MRKYSTILLGLALLIFGAAPAVIYMAPYESTMGLVQKIFYYHVPGALLMLVLAMVGGIASAVFLFTGNRAADRWALAAVEQVVLFGAMTLVTGPLWARKSWGVWWVWEPRLTSTLLGWMVCIAYLLLRHTRLGKAIRATSQDADVALVCGIDVRRVRLHAHHHDRHAP